MKRYHVPVMVEEVLEYLRPSPGEVYLDGTLGTGGHAEALLEASAPTGRVVGIETDAESLAVARERLAHHGDRVCGVHGRFEDAREILRGLGIERVRGILLDLGISSIQLESPDRGFSFSREGPLDMRTDRSQGVSAGELLQQLPEDEMARLFRSYGEERWARRIARAAVAERRTRGGIRTTGDLVRTVLKAIPKRRGPHRIHPATRVFMALRIAVNRELEALEAFLRDVPALLETGGRCCIISFHSLEDRIAKDRMRRWERGCWCERPPEHCACDGPSVLRRVQKKVIRPREEEVAANPLARSARLRVAERV